MLIRQYKHNKQPNNQTDNRNNINNATADNVGEELRTRRLFPTSYGIDRQH